MPVQCTGVNFSFLFYKSFHGHWLLKWTFENPKMGSDYWWYDLRFNFATMVAEGALCVVYDVCYNRSVVEVAMTVKSLKLFLIDMAIQWLGQKYETQLNSGNIFLSRSMLAYFVRVPICGLGNRGVCVNSSHYGGWEPSELLCILAFIYIYIYVCLRRFDFRINIRDPEWV